jgi:hypothetical protein
MNLMEVQIQFYNELSACQAFGTLIFKEKARHDVLCLLGNPRNIYIGTFDDTVNLSLNRFQLNVGIDCDFENVGPVDELETLIVEGYISKINTMKNCFYSDGINVDLLIDDIDEGNTLEDEVLITMASLFGKNIYKGARIPHKNTTRELTDILAFSEFGIFLVEAKALGVVNQESERSMERKVQGLQKQVIKAIKQLVGASKKIAENSTIYNQYGIEIHFNKKLVPHGIILVSELLQFGDWTEIVRALQKAINENNIMINLFDMKEFIRFIRYSNGDRHQFDFFLMQRFYNFIECQSIFLTSKFVERSNHKEADKPL